MKATAPARSLDVRIRDVFGIQDFRMQLQPGRVNVLQGANGSGKTSAVLCALRGLGAEVDVSVRDGAELGTIEVDPDGPEAGRSKVVVPARGRLRASGEPAVTVADLAALTSLITGDHRKDAATRNRARIEAFLQLARPRVDDAAVELLCERDGETMGWLREQLAAGAVTDLLGAADALRGHLQERARQEEKLAAGFEGQEAARLTAAAARLEEITGLGEVEALLEPDLAAAYAEVTRLTRELERTESAAAARRQREEQRDRIRAASTPRPDPGPAEQETRDLLKQAQAAAAEAHAIEEEIARLQERAAAARQRSADLSAQGRQAEQRWLADQRAAQSWDAQQAVLMEPETGPGQLEREVAHQALMEAQRLAAHHRLSAEWVRDREAADDAAQNKARSAARAKDLRAWSRSVQERLADVLARQGVSRFTVDDGRLCYRPAEGAEPQDFDSRLSTGQKIIAAIDLAAERFAGLVYLPYEWWAGLDGEHQAEVEQLAAARPDILIVTEQPTAGPLQLAVTS